MNFDPITHAMCKTKEVDLMAYSGMFEGETMSVGQAILLTLSQGGGNGFVFDGNIPNLVEVLQTNGEKVFLINTGVELYHICPTCSFEDTTTGEKGYGFNYIMDMGEMLLKSFIYFKVRDDDVYLSVTLY